MKLIYEELTPTEILVLRAFRDRDTMVSPDLGLDVKVGEIIEAVAGLRKKNYITGDRPLRLTAKGKRYRQDTSYSMENLNND